MRKLLSILLVAFFGLPLALPLLAMGTTQEAGLRACCRRAGQHKCAMDVGEQQGFGNEQHGFHALQEKCPYAPGAVVSVHVDTLSFAPESSGTTTLATHAGSIAQTECRWRVARDRSRQKRGPPTSILS